MSEYKIGDKFEIVKSAYFGENFKAGKIVEYYKKCDWDSDILLCRADGDDGDYALNFGIEGKASFHSSVRPLKTEAEKRGAKFGVGGVIKETGQKIVFAGNSLVLPGWWEILVEGEARTWHRPPSQIRLDHEPEYREIPFSEATHEQRMDVSALRFDGTPVEQIFQFDNGEYMFTISACKAVANAWNILKVRIPT